MLSLTCDGCPFVKVGLLHIVLGEIFSIFMAKLQCYERICFRQFVSCSTVHTPKTGRQTDYAQNLFIDAETFFIVLLLLFCEIILMFISSIYYDIKTICAVQFSMILKKMIISNNE